jgi:hypothetical protein
MKVAATGKSICDWWIYDDFWRYATEIENFTLW